MLNRIRRVYADTSVFGGCFDEEFRAASDAFFSQLAEGRFELMTSALVATEIQLAPEAVRAHFQQWLRTARIVEDTDDAVSLQISYLEAGIVTPRWADDALHVATAVVGRCDVIVSWNFRHIVHYDKIPLYNAVNALHGWGAIAIHTPAEVVRYDEGV